MSIGSLASVSLSGFDFAPAEALDPNMPRNEPCLILTFPPQSNLSVPDYSFPVAAFGGWAFVSAVVLGGSVPCFAIRASDTDSWTFVGDAGPPELEGEVALVVLRQGTPTLTVHATLPEEQGSVRCVLHKRVDCVSDFASRETPFPESINAFMASLSADVARLAGVNGFELAVMDGDDMVQLPIGSIATALKNRVPLEVSVFGGVPVVFGAVKHEGTQHPIPFEAEPSSWGKQAVKVLFELVESSSAQAGKVLSSAVDSFVQNSTFELIWEHEGESMDVCTTDLESLVALIGRERKIDLTAQWHVTGSLYCEGCSDVSKFSWNSDSSVSSAVNFSNFAALLVTSSGGLQEGCRFRVYNGSDLVEMDTSLAVMYAVALRGPVSIISYVPSPISYRVQLMVSSKPKPLPAKIICDISCVADVCFEVIRHVSAKDSKMTLKLSQITLKASQKLLISSQLQELLDSPRVLDLPRVDIFLLT